MIDYVALNFYPGVNWIGIRELCGQDEQMVDGTGTITALNLIDCLLVNAPPETEQIRAVSMAAADRDRVLAAVYTRTYGKTIESTARCSQCGSVFDLDFSLKDLQATLVDGSRCSGVFRQEDGSFALPSGHRFRLPTGEDEFAVAGLPPADAGKALLRRCLLEGDLEFGADLVQEAMTDVAPLFEVELGAQCPECNGNEKIHFDVQSYLLAALQGEKSRLAWEVHRLACAYGWSLSEILSLSRSDRRTYVDLIERESISRRRFAL